MKRDQGSQDGYANEVFTSFVDDLVSLEIVTMNWRRKKGGNGYGCARKAMGLASHRIACTSQRSSSSSHCPIQFVIVLPEWFLEMSLLSLWPGACSHESHENVFVVVEPFFSWAMG